VILCDTGPLIALIDRTDIHHARCVATLATLPASPLLTTWPCLAEAMYLLWRAGGFPAQDELWAFCADGLLLMRVPATNEWQRLRELMHQYSDTPMDLADASLVATAERHGLRQIFSLDNHFRLYRIHGKDSFEVFP
jgi:uncharacterized protein